MVADTRIPTIPLDLELTEGRYQLQWLTLAGTFTRGGVRCEFGDLAAAVGVLATFPRKGYRGRLVDTRSGRVVLQCGGPRNAGLSHCGS